MKWLIILALIAVVILMIVYRYRKHIQTALFMWRTFRQFRQAAKPQQKQVPKRDTSADTQLVRCPKCNKWTPQGEAVKLKSNYFCSLACLEESMTKS
ncbi:MAG: hypothetical protein R2681_11310 [Pyrinomonadaceae bacterium]